MSPNDEHRVRAFRREGTGYRWDQVGVHAYNAPGTASSRITKQILFHYDDALCSELRYFETQPGGWSALERHDHVHAVLILRGRGRVLVGTEVTAIEEHDLVYIPPQTWHQFYADPEEALGFLCLVNGERDRPTRPSAEELTEMESNPLIREVLRY